MIKVCHLTSVHKENDSRIFSKECVSLANNGFDVSFVVAGADDKVVDNVKIFGVKRITNRFKRIIFSGKYILSKAIELDADIYHFHDPELLRVGVKLRKKGKIVIYDSHEDLPRQILTKHWIPRCCRQTMSAITEFFENKLVRKLSGVVTATPFIQQRFMKVTTKSVCAVCNFPIISEIATNLEVDWAKKEHSACYIGGIFSARGIYEMVGAIGHTSARLKLAGSFSPENLIEELKNESNWEKVDYLGFLDRLEISKLLATSRVGLLILHPFPSYKDSLPIKLFEYMAAGIPVVCTDFELWKEIVEGNHCGICVNPHDINAIADAINFLLNNPEEAKIMGDNGRNAVENNYNWQTQEKILLEMYNNLTC